VIDMPPEPLVSQEQLIEGRLVDCGLNKSGFTVEYQDELQSIEIVISPAAGASNDDFACIREAAGYEIVTFEDGAMYMAYLDFVSELVRPQMLEEARAELAHRGLLEGFPERTNFANDDEFAEALEKHCSIEPKSVLGRSEFGLTILPEALALGRLSDEQWDRMTCLMAALRYVSARQDDFKIVLIGNEKFRGSEGQ
jgi:hypothetical protein